MKGMIRKVLLIVAVCFAGKASGNIIDSLGFASPVDHQIRLTGNFMELRTNHFHAGIDIKSTNGQPGDIIRSVHDGHISRIKIQSGSYGNALYIDHPNGYTSVYAHLHEFTEDIADFVKEIQYDLESFEVDIYLPDSLFRLDKRQIIGKMGNSGRSFGPHLHFELRKTKEEMPVNPEILGIGPDDNSAPVLESFHLHEIGDDGAILNKSVKYFKTKSPEYTLHNDDIKTTAKRVGLGLQMYDRMDGSWNKNGIYAYQVLVDGQVAFSWRADAFTFDETRYINGFWDYERHWVHGQKVYLMYRQNCNPFSYYDGGGDGIIDLSDGQPHLVQITVTDLHKNRTKLKFEITSTAPKDYSSTALEPCDTLIEQNAGFFKVKFPEGTLYFPTDIDISYSKQNVLGAERPTVSVLNAKTSVTGYYEISSSIPEAYDSKYTLITKNSSGRYVQFGGDTVSGRFVTKVDQLGTFSLVQDKTPPKLTPIYIGSDLSRPWKVSISDNLPSDGKARDLAYYGTVNGEWMRWQYDQKDKMLLFNDHEKLPSGVKHIILKVWDHCGNTTTYDKTFR